MPDTLDRLKAAVADRLLTDERDKRGMAGSLVADPRLRP
jgi:hypothetical protein